MKIITTHKGSDFDALASLVAAKLLYPEARPVLPGSINANLKSFLSIHKDLFDFYSPGEIDYDEVETLIVVDTHTWDRLDRRVRKYKEKMNDHHAQEALRQQRLA